jgi:membrane protein DedA with SNARE-associated domain
MGLSAWLLDMAIQLIDRVGYPGISLVLIVDNAGVPIPSEAILGLAGVASGVGRYNLVALFVLGVVMQTLGACLSYVIGYHGGGPLVKRYGKYLFISAHDYDKAQKWFKKRGAKAIFISRLTPVVRTFMGFVAGAARMDFSSFLIQSIFGTVVWTILWLGAGYLLGDSWTRYYSYAHYLDYVVIAGVMILLGRYFWRRQHTKS